MYYYWAYGLKIKSEILFPELLSLPETKEVNVELVLGKVPRHQLEDMGIINQQIFIFYS